MQEQSVPVLDPRDILTPEELCRRLKVKRSWITEKLRPRQKNVLPCYKIGRYLRFSWPDVCAWLGSTSNRKRKHSR